MTAALGVWSKFLQRQNQFRWFWSYSLFCVALLVLLLNLGFWQLARAAEKDAIEEQLSALQASPALAFSTLTVAQTRNYQPILMAGRYLTQPQFLLDNQVHKGKVGFDVISVFRTETGKQVLVNRGFIKGARTRDILPEFDTPQGLVTVEGFLSLPLGEPFMLGQYALTPADKQIIQSVDIKRMALELKQDYYPHLVRINAGYPGVFSPHWQAANMKASKHRGYAFQWFTMALVLLALYWMVSTREIGKNT